MSIRQKKNKENHSHKQTGSLSRSAGGTAADVADSSLNQMANTSTWVIVLTGGARLGYPPNGNSIAPAKEYLEALEESWKRARNLATNQNIITIVPDTHKAYFQEQKPDRVPGKILYQPSYHGTAAEAYHALAYVLAVDDEAQVVIFPAQTVCDSAGPQSEKALLEKLLGDIKHTPQSRGQVLLVARSTELVDGPLGGIAERSAAPKITALGNTSKRISASGDTSASTNNPALTNMGIIVSRASLLWRLCERHMPFLYKRVKYMSEVIVHFKDSLVGAEYIKTATNHAFYDLSDFDLVDDLIQKCPQNVKHCTQIFKPSLADVKPADSSGYLMKSHKLAC